MAITNRVSDAYYGRYGSFAYQRIVRERVHWTCRQARGSRVVDVGCSTGLTPILLAREGFEVVGIDINPGVIEAAEEARSLEDPEVQPRLRFLATGDLDAIDGSFDTAVLGEVIEHVTQPERLVNAVADLLNPGGCLVLTTPIGVHLDQDHKDPVTPSRLRHLLSPRFRLEEHARFSWAGAANQWMGVTCVLDDSSDNDASYSEACIELAEAALISVQFDNAQLREANAKLKARDPSAELRQRVEVLAEELEEARTDAARWRGQAESLRDQAESLEAARADAARWRRRAEVLSSRRAVRAADRVNRLLGR